MSNLVIDSLMYQAIVDGKKISLTPREHDLLKFLFVHKNLVCTTRILYERVYKYSADIESRALNCYIGYLRKKFKGTSMDGKIESLRGIGYRLNYTETNEITGECNCTCANCIGCVSKRTYATE